MEGQNGTSSSGSGGGGGGSGVRSRPQSSATDGKKKKTKKIPDRVTLKKEIGLLSACTIIIGEETPELVHGSLFTAQL